MQSIYNSQDEFSEDCCLPSARALDSIPGGSVDPFHNNRYYSGSGVCLMSVKGNTERGYSGWNDEPLSQ